MFVTLVRMMSRFLKIIWQGWYIDDILDVPPEQEVTQYEVWQPGWPSVEGQVSDNSTSNPAVWLIFVYVMADCAMKIRQSTILVVNLVV
jgi:hypothetical protein